MYAYFAIDTACLEPQWDWCTFVSTPGVHVVWVLIPRYDKKKGGARSNRISKSTSCCIQKDHSLQDVQEKTPTNTFVTDLV